MQTPDLALARRIEAAELRLVSDMAASLAKRRQKGEGSEVFVERLGSGAAVFAGAGSPLTKWLALGMDGPLDEARIDALEREFARRATPPRIELATCAHVAARETFLRRGYRAIGREDVLGLRLDRGFVERAQRELEAAAAEIAVELVERADTETWLQLVVTGFLHPDGSASTAPTESFDRAMLERTFRDCIEVEGFDAYLARLRGIPAGGGGLRRCEGIAQLCGASTLPEHRRRGVQSKLLVARLFGAARSGCDLAVVTTEPDSRSQRNARARGFELLYSRSILAPAS